MRMPELLAGVAGLMSVFDEKTDARPGRLGLHGLDARHGGCGA